MKNRSGWTTFMLMLLVFIVMYLLVNRGDNNIVINYLFFGFVIVLGLYVMTLVMNRKKDLKARSKDKLFNSLVKSSDTIYIMTDSNNNVVYVSSNVEEILGLKKANKTDEQVVTEVLNIPIIKAELKNWDMTKVYVSQMIEYDNPVYNHRMWIKVKIFPYKEKKDSYQVIQIVDATKEHERQHLLVTQATDIKAREIKLNQITSASYDMEMNIDLVTNTCDLKYFKLDNKYFGEEQRGIYTDIYKEILNKYINKNDIDVFKENMSIERLKEHFEKYELDSLVFRYRIGNEVKNNTWLESTVFFLSSRNHNKVSILTKNVTEDAESIRAQNYLLQTAINDVKMADRAKTELIATISHDIRSPLTNIIGLSESLTSKKLSNDVKEDIENIKDSSKEVLNIIDGLLDTSKIEKKTIEKEEKPYNLYRMFKIVEDNAKEYINTKNVKLNVNLDNNLPVILKGDYMRITQAITAIVNNSIKNTSDGEININVRGEKKNDNVNLIIEISDTGIGMTEEKLNEIMNSSDNKGINSVKKLMNLLDGKLEIESKEEEYTRVTLSFIQRIVEDNKVRERLEKNKQAEIFNLKGKKILVIDDNPINLKVTKKLLDPYNADITLIENSIEALDMVKENNIFDLILIDQMMPAMDGTTTLSKLKEIKKFKTPVVVLTADAIKGRREEYLKEGFDDYVSKPIDRKELSRVLERFLKK